MSSFRDQLNKAYELKVIAPTVAAMKRAANIIDADVGENTPVDTGRARSNWFMSVNEPDVRIVAPGQGQHSDEKQALIENVKLTDTIYITNSVPYIKYLNDGSSKQAPKGFVNRAVQVAKHEIEEGQK